LWQIFEILHLDLVSAAAAANLSMPTGWHTGCGKIKDPTTETAISLKRRNNFK